MAAKKSEPASAGKARRQALAADPFLANLQKIDHLVVLMLENRSFDHLLGYLSLPGGRSDVDGLEGTETNDYRESPGSPPVTVKVHHLPSTALGRKQDPCHSGGCVDAQLSMNNGGFVQNYRDTHPGDADPGLVMGYYDASDLPVYDFLATEFAIADRWFSSVPGATWPNRLYMISGKAAGSRDNKTVPLYRNRSWLRHLDAAGVSWKGYGDNLQGHLTLRFGDENYRSSSNYEPFDGTYGFVRDAANGTLPSVSLIDPVFFKNDDHPPGDVAKGQLLVAHVYDALAKNPAAWARTLLVVVYDEHGGFYDHVRPEPAADDDVNFARYGVRVPAIFVGPYVPAGRCFKTVFDHASLVKTILLRFCERNGAIPDMGKRVAAATHLGEVLSEAVARPAESLPVAAVKKLTLRHEQLTLAEFAKPAEAHPVSEDEAAIIRATKQLQASFATRMQTTTKRAIPLRPRASERGKASKARSGTKASAKTSRRRA